MKKGKTKCSNCNGVGQTNTYSNFYDKQLGNWVLKTRFCLKCHGLGEIDWVKNITGLDNKGLYIQVMQHPTTSFENKKVDDG